MTEKEIKQVLTVLQVNYPYSFKNWSSEQAKAFIKLWYGAFKNFPSNIVIDAVQHIIYNDSREYAPNIAYVRSVILETIAPDTEIKAIEAWESVRRYIRRRTGEKEIDLAEYEKLDDITKAIYSFDTLRSMSTILSEQLEYRRNGFIKLYKELTDKKNSELMMIGDVVSLAGGTKEYLSLGYHLKDIQEK